MRPWSWLILVGYTAAVIGASECAARSGPGFEITGRVLDIATKEPIEGAYVIAIYKELVAGSAAVRSYCVKTKGMTTGKDGKFHFPVEKTDGFSPGSVSAIKTDFYRMYQAVPSDSVWASQEVAAYTGRDIFLAKQNPEKPRLEYSFSDELCDRAKSHDAIAAAMEYQKHVLGEFIKYRAPKSQIDAAKSILQDMEALP